MQQHGWTWKTLSQAEKDKYCMISPLCEILKKKTRLIETETRLLVARRQRSGVGHKAGGGGGGGVGGVNLRLWHRARTPEEYTP